MSGVDRDIQCGNSFAKLYELGCFDEEFIVYGCGYMQNGEIRYLISNDGDKLYHFRDEALAQHIYTTPVIRKLTRCPVASGEQEDIRQNIKIELAREIKALYSEAYYQCIAQLDAIPNRHGAESFLKEEQKKLVGYFDRSMVESFTALCKFAYEGKAIGEAAYRGFMEWVRYAERQMENDVVVKEKLKRTFFGFGYEQQGKIRYFADAQMMNVYKKREELLLQGAIVTPIVRKEYWFKALSQLASIRTSFLNKLQEFVDHSYMEKTKTILQSAGAYENIEEIHAMESLQEHEKEAVTLYMQMLGIY